MRWMNEQLLLLSRVHRATIYSVKRINWRERRKSGYNDGDCRTQSGLQSCYQRLTFLLFNTESTFAIDSTAWDDDDMYDEWLWGVSENVSTREPSFSRVTLSTGVLVCERELSVVDTDCASNAATCPFDSLSADGWSVFTYEEDPSIDHGDGGSILAFRCLPLSTMFNANISIGELMNVIFIFLTITGHQFHVNINVTSHVFLFPLSFLFAREHRTSFYDALALVSVAAAAAAVVVVFTAAVASAVKREHGNQCNTPVSWVKKFLFFQLNNYSPSLLSSCRVDTDRRSLSLGPEHWKQMRSNAWGRAEQKETEKRYEMAKWTRGKYLMSITLWTVLLSTRKLLFFVCLSLSRSLEESVEEADSMVICHCPVVEWMEAFDRASVQRRTLFKAHLQSFVLSSFSSRTLYLCLRFSHKRQRIKFITVMNSNFAIFSQTLHRKRKWWSERFYLSSTGPLVETTRRKGRVKGNRRRERERGRRSRALDCLHLTVDWSFAEYFFESFTRTPLIHLSLSFCSLPLSLSQSMSTFLFLINFSPLVSHSSWWVNATGHTLAHLSSGWGERGRELVKSPEWIKCALWLMKV